MALCINPACSSPNHPDNAVQSHCQSCGANLILQGRYRVMRLLTDRSGFGRVYEIFERDQPKILKVLKPTYNGNPKAVQLFEQEALVLGHLDHPGVPRIDTDGCFQVIPVKGSEPLHCIVMEKIDGPNLSEWMRQQGNHPISERQAVHWLQQLVEVLHLVHQQRYFHRDIKPDNIMLRSSGQLVLVDFGAVREMSFTYFEQLEATGGITRISSAGYTPPEQERGQAVPQSDFFSLGCTFIYLLTGKKPTDVDIYHPMTNEYNWQPFAPHISAELAHFIDRLTAPRVVDRPTSTLELLAKVNQLQMALGQSFQGVDLRQGLAEAGQVSTSPPFAPPKVDQCHDRSADPLTANHLATLPPVDLFTGYPDSVPANAAAHPDSIPSPSAAPPLSAQRYNPQPYEAQPYEAQPYNAQPYEIYESSSIPAEVEPYPDSDQAPKLVPHPAPTHAVVSTSAYPWQRVSWRWLGLGVGLIVLAGSVVWGGRSLQPSFSNSSDRSTTDNQAANHKTAADKSAANPETGEDHSASPSAAPSLGFSPALSLQGHTGSVNSLALSLDGQTLVSGSNDRTVRIWNLMTGEKQRQLVGHRDRIHAVALSPNGQTIASGGGDAVIKLWAVESGEAIAPLTGHASAINDLIITPDSQTLISASTDKTIKLWNLVTRTEIGTLTGHSSYINQLSLSPDGTLLASASADRTIKVWNLTSQQQVATLTDHTSPVNTVIFSHDGSRLISGGADNQIKIWDLATYQRIATLDKHTNAINTVKIAPGGQHLVSASADQTLVIWDLNTQQPLQTIPWTNTFIDTVAIRISGPNWQLIAGGEGNHTIQIWDVER
ncbi:MAG: protein kinase [Cyanothece sp. SIO2G6]|nr:protein kinase [Cyanothece sp. SIO2G6]